MDRNRKRARASLAGRAALAQLAPLARIIILLAAVLAGGGGLAAPAAATPWRVAPLHGADVRSLAVHPRQPDLVYAGTSAGQLYVSRDGGHHWRDAGEPLPFPGWVVTAVLFDPDRVPDHPDRIWVALRGIWSGGHVASSDDGGRTWVARGEGLADPVYSLARVAGHEGRLYAGTGSGVWGSRDGGVTWKRLTAALPELQKVTSLYVDPAQPETVIAGTWRQAYRSADGGRTWAGVFDGMVLDSEVFSLTPVPGKPGEIWATTCGWVYRTLDGGGKWERFKEGFEERRTPSFAVLTGGRLLAGTVAGLHASDDGGRTWKRVGDPALSILAIAHHAERPDRVLLGTEGSGVWLSNDGARTFQRASDGMTNLRISALAAAGDELLVGVSHAGPISGVYSSTDRGGSFEGLFTPLPTVLDLAVHAGRPYAATERGLYRRLGKDWHRVPETGERRVEQILSDGRQLIVRTAEGLWELAADKFVARPFAHGAPRSATLWDGALWVTGAKGLYRLGRDTNDTIAAPATGRVARLFDRLLLWAPAGAWVRGVGDGPWIPLGEKPTRVIATGDPAYPALLIAGEHAHLYDRRSGGLRAIALPVPARDIAAALVQDGQLLLGTLGYGLLIGELAAEPAAIAP
jgi:photosystem II stability/assembly factor-like uncharacterized protein